MSTFSGTLSVLSVKIYKCDFDSLWVMYLSAMSFTRWCLVHKDRMRSTTTAVKTDRSCFFSEKYNMYRQYTQQYWMVTDGHIIQMLMYPPLLLQLMPWVLLILRPWRKRCGRIAHESAVCRSSWLSRSSWLWGQLLFVKTNKYHSLQENRFLKFPATDNLHVKQLACCHE